MPTDDFRAKIAKAELTQNDFEILCKDFSNPDMLERSVINPDIKKLLSDAKKALYVETDSKQSDMKYYRLRTIGMDKSEEKQYDPKNISMLDNAVRSLAGCGEIEFCLSCKDKRVSYHIGVKESIGCASVEELVSAYLGQAELDKNSDFANQFANQDDNKNSCHGYAMCLKTMSGTGNENKQMLNWISGIISANIKNDFSVNIIVSRISEKDIQNRIKTLCDIHSDLVKYNDITYSLNTSNTRSLNNKPNIIVAVKDGIQDKISGGDSLDSSSTLSATLSNIRKNPELDKYISLYTTAIDNLLDINSDTGWNVVLRIYADNCTIYKKIKAIIKASFTDSNYLIDWRSTEESKAQLATQVSLKDISLFLKLPDIEFPGFEIRENDDLSLNSTDSKGIKLGKIANNDRETEEEFFIDKERFNRHAFICGMTGSGKSNTTFSLIENCDIPFFVIEPVKGEYRKLKNKYDAFTVYHMNASEPGFFRINPFWFPQGKSNLLYHIDALKSIITSAFSLSIAMPNILEQCICSAYTNRGWNIVSGRNAYEGLVPDEMLYPTFSDLYDEVKNYVQNLKGELRNTYEGALLSRLGSLTSGSKGMLLNNYDIPDYESWFEGRCVVELDALANDADKSIVMGAIIVQYCQFVKQKGMTKNLRHLIIIEEAHRLFKNTGAKSSNSEVAAPEAQIVDMLSNMMAEIRAYGEGLLIIDQSPSKVAEDVIKNSNIKIVHRLDYKKDIDIIEAALLLEDSATLISSLKQGFALTRIEGMQKPAKIKVYKSNIKDKEDEDTTESSLSDVQEENNFEGYASAEYVITNERFREDFFEKITKLVTNMFANLYYPGHKLEHYEIIFVKFKEDCKLLLRRHGFSDILYKVQNCENAFFARLMHTGIKNDLCYRIPDNYSLLLQSLMYCQRVCEMALFSHNGHITTSAIKALLSYHKFQLSPIIRQIDERGELKKRFYDGIQKKR